MNVLPPFSLEEEESSLEPRIMSHMLINLATKADHLIVNITNSRLGPALSLSSTISSSVTPDLHGSNIAQFNGTPDLHRHSQVIGGRGGSGTSDSMAMPTATTEATVGPSDQTNGSTIAAAERDEDLAMIEIGTLITIFVLIVIGNLCVLIALYSRRQKISRMYFFLLWLSIADLITGFFNVLPQLAWDVTYRFYGGNLLCKLVKYLQILGPYLSSYILMMTALDRYQVVCFPLSNAMWNSRRSKTMIIVAWVISGLFCAPQLFIFSYQEVPGFPGIYDCWGTFAQPYGERIYVTWYAISVFFLPLIVIIFAYVCICREIWRNVYLKKQPSHPETMALTTANRDAPPSGVQSHNGHQSSPAVHHTSKSAGCQEDEISSQCHSGLTNCDTVTSSQSPSPSSTLRSKSRSPAAGLAAANLKLLWRVRSSMKSGLRRGTRGAAPPTTTELVHDSEQVMDDFDVSQSLMSSAGAGHGTGNKESHGESHQMTALPSSSIRSTPQKRSRHGSSVLSAFTRSAQNSEITTINFTPRSHSTKGLSRAKIKTVKITVVVVLCYIACSSPFILVQLWAYWWPNAQSSPIWSGPIITILMLLSSLNSCVNPWIYLLFNDDLLHALKRGLLCGKCGTNRPTTSQFAEQTSAIGTTADRPPPPQSSLLHNHASRKEPHPHGASSLIAAKRAAQQQQAAAAAAANSEQQHQRLTANQSN